MHRLLVLSLMLLFPPAALCDQAPGEAQRAADFWLARLRQAYRVAPIAERVTMTVDHANQRESELVVFACQPLDGFREPELSIDLGEIEIWTRPPGDAEEGPGKVRVAHALDYRTYFEAPSSAGTTLDTLRGALPPLMLPQIAFTLGGPLFPGVDEVSWIEASEERPIGSPPRVTLTGVAGDAEIELVLEADDTPRLLLARLEAQPGPVEVTVRCEPIEPSEGRLGYDTARRDRVDHLTDLRERPGDRRAGDPMPDMPLVHFTLDESEMITEAYRHRLVLFYDGHATAGGVLPEAAQIGLEALRRVRETMGPVTRIDPIGVLDPFSGDERHIQVIELDMDQATDPEPAFYTYSERFSVRRFIPEGHEAIVVAAKDGTIAGVIDLSDMPAGVQRDGREATVEALASRVEELCRLIDRRLRGLD
ncbi:MAG: hypothetical protein Tsb0013_18370 [Phycisphaerales bacterium]